jgi:hypothetical protein
MSCSDHFEVAARNTPDPDPDADADPGSHGGVLPDTGGPDIRWLVLGLALVGAGAGTVHVARSGGARHDAARV